MSKKENVLILVSDILVLIMSLILYKIFSIFINSTISSIISYLFVFSINYLSYVKILNYKKNNIKSFFVFSLVFVFSILLKNYISSCIINNGETSFLFSKFISITIFILFSFIFKPVIFSCQANYFACLKSRLHSINEYWMRLISNSRFKFLFSFIPKNIYIALFMFYVFICCFFVIINNTGVIIYSQNNRESNIGPLINEEYIINFSNISDQNINNDIVNNICIPFGTYKRKNNSLLNFKLYDQDDKLIINKTINTKIIKDGVGYCLVIPEQSISNLKLMSLKLISSNADKNNNITIFQNNNGDISLTLYKTNSFYSLKYYIMVLFIVIYFVIVYIINNFGKKIKPYQFFVLMLIYIVPLLFIYPPLEVPDEPVHFKISYGLGQKTFKSFKTSKISVPKNIECLNYSGVESRDKVKELNDIKKCIKQKKNISLSRIFGTKANSGFTFLGYVFSALFLKIADIISNSPLIIFYFGRIGNLLISLFIIYKALKISPVHNRVLLLIVTIPMFIQQMISYSYDSVLNSLSILFIAYFLAIINDRYKIDYRLKIKLFLILLFIFSIKLIYLPIAILICLIPKDKFGSLKNKILYISEIIIGLILFKVLFDYFFNNNTNIIPSGKSNLMFLMNHPLKIFSIIINTFKFNFKFYMESLFGYFSWFRFKINSLTIFTYIIIYLYVILGEKSVLQNRINDKIWIFISNLVMIAAIFGSMYLCWSAYGLNYVDGVQGRYFIPIIGLISLLLISKKRRINVNNNTLYSFINLVLFEYVIYCISYFY